MQHLSSTISWLYIARSSKAIMALWGTLLLFLSAQIQIPISPVPITLQSMSVLLIGLTFSRRDAIRSVITYLSLGTLGLPIFSEFSSGLGVALGSSGGYLFGFIAAVMVMGYLKEKYDTSSLFSMVANCIAGNITIFFFGIIWLATFVGLRDAMFYGFLPFIIPGVIKALMLSLAVKYIYIKK